MRWEKTRLPSALSQIVNAPLNAVRGTLQQVNDLVCYIPSTLNLILTLKIHYNRRRRWERGLVSIYLTRVRWRMRPSTSGLR